MWGILFQAAKVRLFFELFANCTRLFKINLQNYTFEPRYANKKHDNLPSSAHKHAQPVFRRQEDPATIRTTKSDSRSAATPLPYQGRGQGGGASHGNHSNFAEDCDEVA